jgi:hypothetical protein
VACYVFAQSVKCVVEIQNVPMKVVVLIVVGVCVFRRLGVTSRNLSAGSPIRVPAELFLANNIRLLLEAGYFLPLVFTASCEGSKEAISA